MVTSVQEAVRELKGKFVACRYKEDNAMLKQRWKERGNNIYYWLHTFDNLFIQTKPDTRDDLLFYVKYDSKNKKEIIEVLRRDASGLPDHTDSTVFWDQTLYLNILLHEFEYHLTCCVLGKKMSSETLQERMRTQITMQVYPSTTERRMDKKSKRSECSYPNLMFYIDNYEQIFDQMTLHSPGEKVAVQIIASNPTISLRRLIFVGGLDFSVLKDTVKQREKVNSSFKRSILTKKKSYSEFQDDFHFVQMKGPYEKGHAQMAVRLTTGEDEIAEDNIKDCLNVNEVDQTGKPDLQLAVGDSSTCSAMSSNYLMPNPSSTGTCRTTSPSSDSICSTHSNEPLCPSSSSPTCMSEDPVVGTVKDEKEKEEEEDGDLPKYSKGLKRRLSKKKSIEQDNCTVHAFLTFIQLPWYTIAEDIFQGSRDPLF